MLQINLIAIMAMGRLYEYMAERLTVWGELKSLSAYLYVWSDLLDVKAWGFLSLVRHFDHEANKI